MRAKKLLKYIMFIIIYLIINIMLGNKVQAVTQTMSEDINGIDNNKYPGVKQMIQMLQYQYPNWKFKVLYTGLTFDEVITNEYVGHKTEDPRSLVTATHTGEWLCPICGDERYDNGSWCCASETALKYMIDPRNSINSSDVFQFMQLTYTDCSDDDIKGMVAGTFLDNDSYIKTIIRVAQSYNISAYYIVALAIQEQGADGGATVSGTYPGYEGYYNIFNIKASGKGEDVIIKNGLEHAKSKGWDSIEKSIEGGMTQIVNGYITKGQNTLYFQKFDVENSDGNLYWHQYQQNVLAAQNEGVQIRKAFENIDAMDSTYTFIIPLYENTPTEICKQPNAQVHNNNTITSDLVKINASELRIRNLPNGSTTIDWLYQDEIVTRLNKATEKVGGTYWDYIMRADGTRGYVARETYEGSSPYKLYLEPVEINIDIPSGGEEEPEVTIIQSDKVKIDMTNRKVIVIPGATLQDVINLSGENMIAKTATGEAVANETKLATGYTINDTYTVAVLGDVNGDGETTALDAAIILRYTVNQYSMSEIQIKAGVLDGTDIPTALDAAKILRYTVGQYNINIQ